MNRLTTTIQVFLFLFPIVLWGQIDMRLATSSDSLQLGGEIELKLSLNAEDDILLTSAQLILIDSLGYQKILMPEDSILAETPGGFIDFEISDYGNLKETGNTVLIPATGEFFDLKKDAYTEYDVKIRIWEAGNFLLLFDKIQYQDSNGEMKTFYPDFLHGKELFVLIPLEKGETSIDQLQPNKDILREHRNWKDFKWLYITIGAILLFVFLITRPTRQKRKIRKQKEKTIIIRPAHDIAFEKMETLKGKKLWESGEVKAYQSELTYIIREYLENRYSIKALESVTEEIKKDLKKMGMQKEDRDVLGNLLQIADLVKFAKAEPEVEIHEKFFQQAMAFIEKTKEITELKE